MAAFSFAFFSAYSLAAISFLAFSRAFLISTSFAFFSAYSLAAASFSLFSLAFLSAYALAAFSLASASACFSFLRFSAAIFCFFFFCLRLSLSRAFLRAFCVANNVAAFCVANNLAVLSKTD